MVALNVVYDARVVVITCVISFIGGFGAVSACEQFRLAAANAKYHTMHWLWLVACAFGGVCIWGTHFVGMASFKLMLDDVEIPFRFDLGNMMYLLAVQLITTFSSIYIASTDDCFNRSKQEIMEKFIAHASATYKLSEIKHMSQWQMLYIVLTHSIQRLVLGGTIAGASVCIMHYVGMMGITFQGTITYDWGIVAGSCVTSIIVIVAAFWIFFRILSMFPSLDFLRIICAFNGVFAVSGMHYMGLQAATFNYNPEDPMADVHTSIDKHGLLVGVVVTAVMVVIVMLVLVLSDLRAWLLRTSIQLRHANLTIEGIQKQCAGRTGRFAQITRDTKRYMHKYVYAEGGCTPGTEDGAEEAARQRLLFYDFSDNEEDRSFSGRTSGSRASRAHTNTNPDLAATGVEGGVTGFVEWDCLSENTGGDAVLHDLESQYPSGTIKDKPSSPALSSRKSQSTKASSIVPNSVEEFSYTPTHGNSHRNINTNTDTNTEQDLSLV